MGVEFEPGDFNPDAPEVTFSLSEVANMVLLVDAFYDSLSDMPQYSSLAEKCRKTVDHGDVNLTVVMA